MYWERTLPQSWGENPRHGVNQESTSATRPETETLVERAQPWLTEQWRKSLMCLLAGLTGNPSSEALWEDVCGEVLCTAGHSALQKPAPKRTHWNLGPPAPSNDGAWQRVTCTKRNNPSSEDGFGAERQPAENITPTLVKSVPRPFHTGTIQPYVDEENNISNYHKPNGFLWSYH